MMTGNIAYIPGQPSEEPALLSRYLPPIPFDAGATWLRSTQPPGSWILDPFGATPQLAIEAARAGYRILIASGNPVTRYLLELMASPPKDVDLRAALAHLAASRKGEERLELHIRDLYLTHCEQCDREIVAEAFLWKRNASSPYGRIYLCPHCGDKGEHPVNPADIAKATRFNSAANMHRARALERVAPPGDPDRINAEEALEAYLPRAVYALFTLINKLESYAMPSLNRHLLTALILHACDKGNTLWPYPTGRARPRQITIPPQFRENNIWLALEQAIDIIATLQAGVSITRWPELPAKDAGIVVFEGRLKDLAQHFSSNRIAGEILPGIEISAVLTALPRPNQAFWTLSALWAGWLWGRAASGPFKTVLRRRRYDWAWHSGALCSTLNAMAPLLSQGIPILGFIGETEPGFLSAAMIAFELAGYDFQGLALRSGSNQAQLHWRFRGTQLKPRLRKRKRSPTIQQLATKAANLYLLERAEPATYLQLHASALAATSKNLSLYDLQRQFPAEVYGQVQGSIEKAFSDEQQFVRFGGSDKSLEVGQWWLSENVKLNYQSEPSADRVESEVVKHLNLNPVCDLLTLDRVACETLPGLLTPDIEFVQVCLASYCEEESPRTGKWRLREQDTLRVRQNDILSIRTILKRLGEGLGYSTHQGEMVVWKESDDRSAYIFYVLTSATIGKIIFTNPYPADRSFIVLPGSRANIVTYKLRHNALLDQAVKAGWRFLKFRHLRRLAESGLLTRDNLEEQFALDPLTDAAPQLRLL